MKRAIKIMLSHTSRKLTGDYLASSPEIKSGQAIWQLKTQL